MSKMINEFTLTHLQPVFASPRNNAMIVLRIKLRCCMRLDLDHSPLYTFYNMNGLGWEPRQKVDCISSGYFYPVFAFISTRDIPILLGDENNILSLEPDLGMLTSPCPGDCCWTHNIYPVWCPLLSPVLTGCSCSLFPGQCWWQGPARARDTHDTVSRQCHESARMSCCHESDRHLWCLLVSQHCILSLHLPTSTLTWYNTRYSLPSKYLYQNVCPPDSCYC